MTSDRTRLPGTRAVSRTLIAVSLVTWLHLVLWFALQPVHRSAPDSAGTFSTTWLTLVPAEAPAALPRPVPENPRPARKPKLPVTADARPTVPDNAPETTEPAAITPPSIDLDAARKLALAVDRDRDRSGVAGLKEARPATLTKEERLGQEIGRAARKDCTNAYSGIGLLAVIPLAVDLFRENGCKW